MYILAIDTSCAISTVAVTSDDKLLAEITLNLGNTHSETLLPTIDLLLRQVGLTANDISLFAVTLGPGSFTGIRIGVATVKGLAFGRGDVCIGVSALDALAQACPENAVICPVINARHSSVYTAMFRKSAGSLEALEHDDILTLDELAVRLKALNEPVYLSGDCCKAVAASLPTDVNAITLPKLDMPSAYYVALAALQRNSSVSADALNPIYLRKSQAEQEREARLNKNNN